MRAEAWKNSIKLHHWLIKFPKIKPIENDGKDIFKEIVLLIGIKRYLFHEYTL
jgi:hypothetical protein